MFVKKVFLKGALLFQKQAFIDPLQSRWSWIIYKIHRKKPVLESLFNKVAVLRACNFIKEGSDTILSCEICKLSKNNYFEEHLWMSSSKLKKRLQRRFFPVHFVNYSRTPIICRGFMNGWF